MSSIPAPQPRILVVLPESHRTKELVVYLERQGFEVLWAREGQSGYDILDAEPVDALICDLRDPRIDGLRMLQVARQRNAEICAIVIAGPEEMELGVEAMRQGAYDFQLRPLNLAKINAVLERGLSHQQLVGEVFAHRAYQPYIGIERSGVSQVCGGAAQHALHVAMRRVYRIKRDRADYQK